MSVADKYQGDKIDIIKILSDAWNARFLDEESPNLLDIYYM